MESYRKMPDRILDDFSNLRTVVEQFRNLGYGDTYILETVMNVADVKNSNDIPDIDTMLNSYK